MGMSADILGQNITKSDIFVSIETQNVAMVFFGIRCRYRVDRLLNLARFKIFYSNLILL